MMKPSDSPSENACWLSSLLPLSNGSTAIELLSAGNAGTGAAVCGSTRSTTRSVSSRTTATASTTMMTKSVRRLWVLREASSAIVTSLSSLIPLLVNS